MKRCADLRPATAFFGRFGLAAAVRSMAGVARRSLELMPTGVADSQEQS